MQKQVIEDEGPVIEFECPRDEPWRWGLNPNVAGYRQRIADRSKWLAIGCAVIGGIGCSLSIAGLLSWLPGLLMLLLSVCVLAARHWMLTRGQYCGLCGACTKPPLAKQRLVWCPGCDNLNDPGQIGVGGSEIFDVTRPENFYHADPIASFLAMTISLAVLDKGHSIRYEPSEDRYRVAIAIADEVFELEDPPAHIQFAVAQTIKALAGLDIANCREPQRGRLAIRVYDRTVSAEVLVEPVQYGQRVVLDWPVVAFGGNSHASTVA